MPDSNDDSEFFDELDFLHQQFYEIYRQERVYFPLDIANDISAYGRMLDAFLINKKPENFKSFLINISEKEDEIVLIIQKYIGIA